jgi:hypothetical protein
MRGLAIAALVSLPALAPALAQETPKVPKDSVRVVATGCLKGRVLRVTGSSEVDVQTGPDVTGRSFRLAGKKDVISEVKRQDGNTVEVVGLVRKMDLEERGLRFKGGRIIVGGGRPTDPTRPNLPDPADQVAVMDISSLRAVSAGCAIDGR